MNQIFTIGYEGGNFQELVAVLRRVGVSTLIDVREMPLSRKPGLSKTSLTNTLPAFGIAYRHERWLGAPKPIRDALKRNGDWTEYFARFDAYLETKHEDLVQFARQLDGSVALMCFERDPDQCHRKSVARELGNIAGIRPCHIGLMAHARSTRSPLHSGQGLSAA